MKFPRTADRCGIYAKHEDDSTKPIGKNVEQLRRDEAARVCDRSPRIAALKSR
jgi:hypothetical protein